MKKCFTFFVAMCIMLSATVAQVSVWDGSHTAWTNGNGTQANPYLIENAAQFAHLAYIVNNGTGASGRIVGADTYWKLMIDINLNGSVAFQWTPIGYYTSGSDYYAFGGNFDGNNHTVVNLYISTTTLQYIGLFGYTDGASIKNLSITGNSSVSRANASQNACAGGIAGYANNTNFDNCYNTGKIYSSANYSSSSGSSYSYSGGIVGYIVNSTIINNCHNTGDIFSYSNYYSSSGGIVGYVSNIAIIDTCYNTGKISSYSNLTFPSYSGGIVGCVSGTATIDNCYNTEIIYAYSSNYYTYAGGIVGYVIGTATINNCYNMETIKSSSYSTNSYSGGIVGYIKGSATITNCHNTVNIESSAYYNSFSGGIIGYVFGIDIGTIINKCYNTGNIISNSSYGSPHSGGIIGYIYDSDSGTTINNCYNMGTISNYPSSYAGGIVGYIYGSSTIINNCYNTGSAYIPILSYGVIIGFGNCSVNNSYYLNTCGGNNTYGGEPKTEIYMKDIEFVYLLNSGPVPNNAYTQDIALVNNGYPIHFVTVLNISGVPTTATAGIPLTLTGTVIPSNATNQTIIWEVVNTETTGATISEGNILNAVACNTVVIRATIANGLGYGENYTKDFSITVIPNITLVFSGIETEYCSDETISELPETSDNGITGTWSPAINNTATTTYTFTPNAGQCASTAQVTITINQPVTPVFSGIQQAYAAGATIPPLPATSDNGISGTWSPAINNTETTSYTFTPNAGQCATTAVITISITTGIDDVFENQLTIYPNPVGSQLRIINYELRGGDYTIFSVTGQIVGAGFTSAHTGETTIDVSTLPSGVYFIKVGDKVGKFIKE